MSDPNESDYKLEDLKAARNVRVAEMRSAGTVPDQGESKVVAAVALGSADRRLRGLEAAQCAINSFIKEARAACEPYGPRQGRKLEWWRGKLAGLVAAKAMLALADFPEQPDNAAQIEKLLSPNKQVSNGHQNTTDSTS